MSGVIHSSIHKTVDAEPHGRAMYTLTVDFINIFNGFDQVVNALTIQEWFQSPWCTELADVRPSHYSNPP